MAEVQQSKEFLCDVCPGRGNPNVDFDVLGACPYATVDSFRQTRRYGISSPQDYASDQELAELSSATLQYWNEVDEDNLDPWEVPGDYEAALLGAKCAKMVLSGQCQQPLEEVLSKSEIE